MADSSINSYGHKRLIHLHRQPRTTKSRGLVEYFSLATCFYEGGKNQKKIIHGLGELTKEQAEQYRLMLKVLNGQIDHGNLVDIDTLVYDDEKQYLDVLAMSSLWDQLGLDKVFTADRSNGQHLSTEQVARILTINRLLHPSSKIRTAEWLNGTLLPSIMGIDGEAYNRSKIFRELGAIHQAKERIEKLFWEHSQKEQREYDAYYFDGSTSWFEGGHCSLAEDDLEKTRGFFPSVIGLMLITGNRGFPVGWEIVNGHTKDTTELKNFVERISNKFGIKEITYCFDRGVASEKNFDFIENNNSKYISAIRDNQIKDVLDLEKFWAIRVKITDNICNHEEAPIAEPIPQRRVVGIDGFHSFDKNIYFKDLGIVNQKRYVVSFNYELFIKEHHDRQDRIEKTLLDTSEKNDDLKNASRDRDYNATERDLLSIFAKHHVREYFEYSLKPLTSNKKAQSFKIELALKKDKIHHSQLTDGILVYITNHTEKNESKDFIISAKDIVAHYKGKHAVENAFREMKSFLSFRPIHVWTEEHVKAHYDINIIACFINNFINVRIKELDRSIRDFHEHLEKAGRVAKLVAPSGVNIFKLKKISEETRRYFEQLEISRILSPALHKSHAVSQ